MSATNVDLSKAILAKLNDETFSLNFEATRRVVPFSNITEIINTQVVVFDGPKAAERMARTVMQRSYKPTVAVLKKLPSGDDASRLVVSDELQELVEEIEAALVDVEMAGLTFLRFDEEQDRDPYNVELIKSLGAFAVAIGLEYSD